MKILKEWGPFALILLMIILVRSFIVTPIKVDGPSMNQTLEHGDILLLNKFDQKYERFEIVVFEINGEKLIKRIIGLPGEMVEFKNKEIYINGEILKEEYGYYKDDENYDFNLEGLTDGAIPKDCYFVLGDNRNNSTDSRFFGCIPKDKIIGTVHYALFPFTKFGKI